MSKERQSGRARLLEVASLAGVSPTTVSLVLSGKAVKRRISEKTHEKVRRAAEELNYAPNLLTRSLRGGRTHILSFYSTFRHREQDDLYMDKLSSAIEPAGGDLGYDILVHCNFKRSPKEIYQFLNGGLADGLILFAPLPDDPLLQLLQKSQLPVVIVNGRDPAGLYPSVADDVVEGMRMVSDQLVGLGHTRIASLLGEGPDARDANIRVSLLKANLAGNGITVPNDWSPHAGADVLPIVQSLMKGNNRPTAIFCWHDRLAYQVLAACDALGISVPEEVSVVGYDGLQWPSATRHIAASVGVDLHGLASRAVSLLDRAIMSQRSSAPEVLPVSFIEGTSLGRPRP